MVRRFGLGLAAGLLVFVLINLLVAHLRSDCGLLALLGRSPCADDIRRAGWPWLFLEQGGFIARHTFLPLALAGDVVVGLIFGVVTGRLALIGWRAE
jgi:hypothetical protein